MNLFKPGVLESDTNKIMFASTFLVDSAAIWWFTMVNSSSALKTWVEFCTKIRTEFIPVDYVRRTRDRLRRLKQKTSVSKYLSDFRNIILTLPEVTEGEQFDKFINGLKSEVRLEVLKSTASTIEEAAHIALRVDSAMWRFENYEGVTSKTRDNGPISMEIGNIQSQKSRTSTQRRENLANNSCFRCHKSGCRPWKYGTTINTSTIHINDDE